MAVSVVVVIPAIAAAIAGGYLFAKHYMTTAGIIGDVGQAVFAITIIGAGMALAFQGGLYFVIGVIMVAMYTAVFLTNGWSAIDNIEDSSWRRRLNG